MDSVKRARRIVFDKVPLDCWGHVITFLRTPEDFMSLVLVVKGLWEYVNTLCPSSTKFVEFFPRKIPSTPKRYVSNLVHRVKYEGGENDGHFLNIEVEKFFHTIFLQFPNLCSFSTRAKCVNAKEDQFHSVLRNISFPNSFRYLSLKLLTLAFHCGSLIFDFPHFPNLEKLEIMRIGGYNDISNNSIESSLEMKNLQNISNLRILELYSWNLKNSVTSISNHLTNLTSLILAHVVQDQGEIVGFESLKKLYIAERSIISFRTLNVKSLENLNISQYRDDYVIDNLNPVQNIKLSFDHVLPNLRTLEIAVSVPCSYLNDRYLSVSSTLFPSLRSLQLENDIQTGFGEKFIFKVIVDHKKLKELDVECWDNFDIFDENSLLEIRRFRYNGKMPRKLIAILPKLKKLKIFMHGDNNYNSYPEIDLDVRLSFVDCEFLEICRNHVFPTQEIRGCPRLEELHFIPSSNFKYNFEKKLKHAITVFRAHENENIDKIANSKFRKFDDFLSKDACDLDVEFLSIQVESEFSLPQSCKIFQSGLHFKKSLRKMWLLFDMKRWVPLEMNLSGFVHLEEFTITQIHGCYFNMCVSLKDFPELEFLSVGILCVDYYRDDMTTRRPDIETLDRRLRLEGIQNCTRLEVTPFTLTLNRWSESLPHITLLEVVLNDRNWMVNDHKDIVIVVSGKEFPVLEKISIAVLLQENEISNEELEVVDMISNLDNLNVIEFKGFRHNRCLLIRAIENVKNIGKVRVEWEEYDMETDQREKRVTTLVQYNQQLSKKLDGKKIIIK